MDFNSPLAIQKAALRASLKQIRALIPADKRAKSSRRIAQRLFTLGHLQQAQSVFVYISAGSEVETHEILKRLLAEGKRVVVPKILKTRQMVACHFTDWSDLQPGTLGILTPITSEAYEGKVDITVMPGLGFTVEGHRLGFGAGYYDRWLATHQAGIKIALAYEAQIVESIPIDSSDVAVDMILTEQRIIHAG